MWSFRDQYDLNEKESVLFYYRFGLLRDLVMIRVIIKNLSRKEPELCGVSKMPRYGIGDLNLWHLPIVPTLRCGLLRVYFAKLAAWMAINGLLYLSMLYVMSD